MKAYKRLGIDAPVIIGLLSCKEMDSFTAPLVLRSSAPEINRAPFMKMEKTITPDGKERISVIMN